MIEAGELVCDVINDFLIKMDPNLSHGWQLAYTAGEKWSLKNEQKVTSRYQLTTVDERPTRVQSRRNVTVESNEGIPQSIPFNEDTATNGPSPFPIPFDPPIFQRPPCN